ncbi:hypothetical protein FNV43_RR25804 [Rhamnella rubrinervis]|uniref:Cytochrome P450 n=1 Tax=Rhamnella rubrinervis TaxID=2594499 RepID=A0A8K0DN32_9ROSA|nr:hypothetical protein FNV43_RR25804 [Rhamnella rubrinervis]
MNLLCTIIFSVNLADPIGDNGGELKDTVWGILVELGKPNLENFFPLLRKLDPQGIRKRSEVELFNRIINQRLQSRKLHGSSTTYNDILNTLLNISEENSSEALDKTMIERLFLDLFGAGTEQFQQQWSERWLSCYTTLRSCAKAQAELDQVIGKRNQVKESDIARLPYLQALVKETFRLHPAVPLLLPRKVDAEVEIWRFTIPKGAQVLVNTWAIGRDSSLLDNPNKFIPESKLRAHSLWGGRRICPGPALAMRMLHLMLGSLIYSFDWKLEDEKTVGLEDKFGLTLQLAQPLGAIPKPHIWK